MVDYEFTISRLMKKQTFLFFLSLCVTFGCSTAHQETNVAFDNNEQKFIDIPSQPKEPLVKKIIKPKEENQLEPVEKTGVVFAKTEFEGVLKTSYVRLKIQDLKHEDRVYQLHIGEKSSEAPFPWKVKTVNPGYFYIDLPEGSYRFSTITIPVGSTTAIEEMNILFNVFPEQVVYLGTLKMNGTKERIKVGGDLPLIKPGFEYQVQIVDQFDDAKKVMAERFPNAPQTITSQLMTIP